MIPQNFYKSLITPAVGPCSIRTKMTRTRRTKRRRRRQKRRQRPKKRSRSKTKKQKKAASSPCWRSSFLFGWIGFWKFFFLWEWPVCTCLEMIEYSCVYEYWVTCYIHMHMYYGQEKKEKTVGSPDSGNTTPDAFSMGCKVPHVERRRTDRIQTVCFRTPMGLDGIILLWNNVKLGNRARQRERKRAYRL